MSEEEKQKLNDCIACTAQMVQSLDTLKSCTDLQDIVTQATTIQINLSLMEQGLRSLKGEL